MVAGSQGYYLLSLWRLLLKTVAAEKPQPRTCGLKGTVLGGLPWPEGRWDSKLTEKTASGQEYKVSQLFCT